MNHILTATCILAAATLLVSCGADHSKSHQNDSDAHSSHSVSATSEDGLEGLGLNNGQKWKMDNHTRTIFAKMAESFVHSDHSSLKEDGLKKAGATLQLDINELIQGCTMTGDAHNQLHIYLTGYIPAVAALSDSGQIADAEKIKHYLEKYGDYFE